MALKILPTDDALRDLEEIDCHIATHDAPEKADYVLGKIPQAFLSLSNMPERGAYPKELISLGIKEYREILFKPYRRIYRVFGNRVCIYAVADGR
jgi:toxin ParE1/3/4